MRDYDTLSFLRSSRLLTRFDVPNLPFENRWHHDLITDLFIRVDETCADLDMKAEKNILPFTTNNRAFNAESGTLFDLGKFISVDRACFVDAADRLLSIQALSAQGNIEGCTRQRRHDHDFSAKVPELSYAPD